MKKITSIEDYLASHKKWSDEITELRRILYNTELTEAIKWSAPTYALKGKNVLAIGAFKNHFGIWFFNGVFLKDDYNLLSNAQEKTKALRQMKFKCIEDINKARVLEYVKEAIENQKSGKEFKQDRSKKETIIPLELKEELNKNTELLSSFKILSSSKQREYCDYISSAKRDVTKYSRLEKIKPMIILGAGLHDKYKNC